MSMERLRNILSEAGIKPRGEDDADINAMCELYTVQTCGQTPPLITANGLRNVHIASAMRMVVEGWGLNVTSRLDDETGRVIYELKTVETMDPEMVGKTHKVDGEDVAYVPRTIGLGIRSPSPDVPNDLANSILNIHFSNALNAIHRHQCDIHNDLVAENVPE